MMRWLDRLAAVVVAVKTVAALALLFLAAPPAWAIAASSTPANVLAGLILLPVVVRNLRRDRERGPYSSPGRRVT